VNERLAILGGEPTRATLLPYGRQQIDDGDIRAVVDVLQSEWLTTGPKVAEYETAFAEYVGAKYAVAVSSGTAALHAAAFAAGVGPGDEVITTPLTFVASANCARYLAADPVFADVQEDTLNISPQAVCARLSRRTRAIVAVDFTGQPADLDELLDIATSRQVVLIEDACHALGSTYRGRPVGGLAAMTVFSTHPVKHVATGEGGVVTTNDAKLAERVRLFRNHGITSDARTRQEAGSWFYEMTDLGYNYRLTDIQCALGITQLRKQEAWLARRRQIAERYTKAFDAMPALRLPHVKTDRRSAWHLYVVRLRQEHLECTRADIFRALRAENIGVNVHYIPVTWQPYYRALGHGPGECPIADAAYETLISIPIFPAMSNVDVDDVIRAMSKVMAHYAG
jgi:perosamine synthetase